MRIRGAFLFLVSSLLFGGVGPVFADVTAPSRPDQVTSIQAHYNPLFDVQYSRLLIVRKKVLAVASTLATVKAVQADFLDMRRIINSNLSSSTSDLDSVRSFADEELGEFESSISQLEFIAAKSKTISCIKGKVVKKVSGVTPKCPTGYKKK